MNFKETILQMTPKEIILTMVESLKNPVIRVNMRYFGGYNQQHNNGGFVTECFGCAATNTVCRIAQKTFTPDNIKGRNSRATFLYCEEEFLMNFEFAIDALRTGDVEKYNSFMCKIHPGGCIPESHISMVKLTEIHNDNYKQQEILNPYIKLANLL